MLKFKAHSFAELANFLAWIETVFRSRPAVKPEQFKEDKYFIKMRLAKGIPELRAIGLIFSAKKMQSIVNDCDSEVYDADYFMNQFRALSDLIQSELEEGYFLHLTSHEAGLFAPQKSLVGGDVEKKFPSILYEIEECAKCAALGRDTASAFHAIRSLEAAIRAISRCLGIPDPTKAKDRNWSFLLSDIKDEIERRWPGNNGKLHGDGKFFDEAYGLLSGFQNPYRNATMHLDAKYSADESEVIRVLVRAFLVKIASRMDEQGLPLA